MRAIDYARLVVLGAIWGGSFIFLRELSPSFGALPTAMGRPLIAGIVLLLYMRLVGQQPMWRERWRGYLLIGIVGCAMPFSCFAFAARHIPAAYSAIFNSSTSLFLAVLAVFWLNEPLTLRKLAGVALGICGVALVAEAGGAKTDTMFYLGVLACLGASTCYAVSSIYTRKHLQDIPPASLTACSQLLAALAILPLLSIDQPGAPTLGIAWHLAALGVLSSGVAYLIYYRLLADVGPTRTMTVTFLQPAFAMLWGAIFLSESITVPMLAGCGLIIAGVLLVTRAGRAAVETIEVVSEPAPAS